MLPEEGKLYWHYDDGKVRPSRQEKVKVLKVVPYSEVSKEIRERINKEIKECDWLYNDVISHVVFASNLNMIGYPWNEHDHEIIYLPSKRDGWYGFGVNCYWNQGRLDIDGKLTESIQFYFYKCCPLFPEN